MKRILEDADRERLTSVMKERYIDSKNRTYEGLESVKMENVVEVLLPLTDIKEIGLHATLGLMMYDLAEALKRPIFYKIEDQTLIFSDGFLIFGHQQKIFDELKVTKDILALKIEEKIRTHKNVIKFEFLGRCFDLESIEIKEEENSILRGVKKLPLIMKWKMS